MKRHHYIEELNSLNATRKPAKSNVTLKDAVAGLGERVKSQRLAAKAMSVNWTGK